MIITIIIVSKYCTYSCIYPGHISNPNNNFAALLESIWGTKTTDNLCTNYVCYSFEKQIIRPQTTKSHNKKFSYSKMFNFCCIFCILCCIQWSNGLCFKKQSNFIPVTKYLQLHYSACISSWQNMLHIGFFNEFCFLLIQSNDS